MTGSARIRSHQYRDELFQWCRGVASDIIGGEMEGIGLLALAPPDDPNWVIVKGICDFADGNQKADAKGNRSLACKNAVTFALDALSAWKPGTT